ncbi:HNH endonuclease signature motif containing protein [Rheinheimera faecalis]
MSRSVYDEPRPTISAELRRAVNVESGHACAIKGCAEHTYLEIHHIDENRENNTLENLVLLCDKHHKMAHAGVIDRKELREYKKLLIGSFDSKIISKINTYEILVNRSGIASQSKQDLEAIIDKIIDKIRSNKPYQIHVINSDFSKLLGSKDDGIRGALNKDLSDVLLETSRLIDLLLNSWCMGLIPNDSTEDLFQIVRGALKVACLDKQLNPFHEYLDIWFNKNHAFRTLAILERNEAKILFQHFGISNIMQIMEGCVLDLPREILYSEAIPKVYFALQKYSDQRNFESIDSLFDLKYWSYGAG